MLFRKQNMARILNNQNKGKRTFLIYSLKMGYLLFGESYLEYWGIILLDLDRKIRRLTTQPFTIRYTLEGKFRNYTPDALVELYDGTLLLIEFKYFAESQKEDKLEKHQRINEIVMECGYSGLLTQTEHEICLNPRLDNSIKLHRYGRGHCPNRDKILETKNIINNEIWTFAKLTNATKSIGIHYDSIMHLAAHNILQLDINTLINPTSQIQWNPDYEL